MKRKKLTAEAMLRQQAGKQIKRFRLDRGLTQTQLGALTGREQGTISRLETGDYPTLTFQLILDMAYALECEPAELFSWPLGVMDIYEHQKRDAELQAVAS
jgi:transcriptional regulator with XRE-family HTH domain